MTVVNRRRGPDRRVKDVPVEVERRSGADRRFESAGEQIQIVIAILAQVSESEAIGDEDRRLIDTAVMRLRFAAERMEPEE